MKLFMWLIHIFIRWPAEETSIGLTNVSLNGDSFSWKAALLIYFVLFLTTLRMCYRSMKGILGSCESLCLIFIMLFNFFFISFVVGSLWVVLRSSSVIWRSLWVVVGRLGFSDYWSVGWKPNYVTLNNPESYKFYKNFIRSETIK